MLRRRDIRTPKEILRIRFARLDAGRRPARAEDGKSEGEDAGDESGEDEDK